jgi:dihydrolipoamide dehydrogenase
MTNVPNIFAIGDIIDGPMLAHKASEEGHASPRSSPGTARAWTTSAYPTSSIPIPRWPRSVLLKKRLKAMGLPQRAVITFLNLTLGQVLR